MKLQTPILNLYGRTHGSTDGQAPSTFTKFGSEREREREREREEIKEMTWFIGLFMFIFVINWYSGSFYAIYEAMMFCSFQGDATAHHVRELKQQGPWYYSIIK